jgi:hypothetical protein
MTNSLTNLAEATDILDIRPPVLIPNYWLWVWVALGALGVLAVAVFFIRRALRRHQEVPRVPPVPAHVRARQRLEEALQLIGDPKPFVIAVSDTLRAYLEEALELRAPERTTEEFLVDLQGSSQMSDTQKDQLADFLGQSDLVKFAKHEPEEHELRALHSAALELVAQTEPAPDSLTTSPTVASALRTPHSALE